MSRSDGHELRQKKLILLYIYTTVDTHIETIKFKKDQWMGSFLPRLTKFYFEYMMDKVFLG